MTDKKLDAQIGFISTGFFNLQHWRVIVWNTGVCMPHYMTVMADVCRVGVVIIHPNDPPYDRLAFFVTYGQLILGCVYRCRYLIIAGFRIGNRGLITICMHSHRLTCCEEHCTMNHCHLGNRHCYLSTVHGNCYLVMKLALLIREALSGVKLNYLQIYQQVAEAESNISEAYLI